MTNICILFVLLLISALGEQTDEACNFETSTEELLPQCPVVPNWSSMSGKWTHFLHPETQFMLFCVALSCVVCWNWCAICCFVTGTKKQSREGMSDFEATKLGISESAAGICVFSLFMTTVAPVVRLFRKKWFTVTPFFSINESLGMHFHEHSIAQNAGPDYDLKPVQDLSWIGHAVLGLLWVLLGCAAIRSGAGNATKNGHKQYIGMIAMVSLLFHFLFSCSNVFVDGANHTWMNKICLLSAWPSIFLNVTKAMTAVFDKRLSREQRVTKHMRHMFLGWIQSIEGSGQIRLVGTINYISGNMVTHYCKNHLYSFSGSECAWKYLERGFFATCVSGVYLCLYSWRTPSDKKMREHVQSEMPATVVYYAIFKFAEYLNAQYIMTTYQLIQSAARMLEIVKIIRNGLDLPEVSSNQEETDATLLDSDLGEEVSARPWDPQSKCALPDAPCPHPTLDHTPEGNSVELPSTNQASETELNENMLMFDSSTNVFEPESPLSTALESCPVIGPHVEDCDLAPALLRLGSSFGG